MLLKHRQMLNLLKFFNYMKENILCHKIFFDALNPYLKVLHQYIILLNKISIYK